MNGELASPARAAASASDAIVTVDGTGTITSWNHSAESHSHNLPLGDAVVEFVPAEHS